MKGWWIPFALVGSLMGWSYMDADPPVLAPDLSPHQRAIFRDAAYNLGKMSYEEGDLAEAQFYFEEALTYDPGFLDGASALCAVVMQKAGKTQDPEVRRDMMAEVVEGFAQIAQRRPTNPQDWRNLSMALHNAGMPQEALVALQKAEELGG